MLNDRYKWFFEGRRGPDGFIPINARYNALQQEKENIKLGLLKPPPAAIPGNYWDSIGPAPTGSWSGRVSAMVAVDANTIYAGGAQGGIWKTTDAGSTWTPLTDQKESLATGSIALAPSDNNIIYVGTGESNHSCDSYFGAGVLKSTDAGANWTLLANSTFEGTSFSKILVHPTDPNTVWGSTTRGTGGFICQRPAKTYGVWKSTDGGVNWNLVLGQAQTGVDSWSMDLVMDPTDSLTLYAAVHSSGVWKTTNGGTSWVHLTTGLPSSNIGVIDIAIDPTNNQILYATIENYSSGAQLGFYKTTNAGSSWSSMTIPSGGACSSYCWYCMYVDVSPNGQYVWLGGVNLYRSNNTGCCSWTSMGSAIHVDQHAIAWPGDGSVWVGNDGGVYRSPNLSGGSWSNKNTGIYITQFYPGTSLHPTNANGAIGGTQDNSSCQYTGSDSWLTRGGGDGAYTEYDFSNPNNVYYISSQYLYLQKTNNGGSSFSTCYSGLSDANTSNAAFIAPYEMCPNNSQQLIAGSDNVWKTTNGASSWSSNSLDPIASGVQIRAMAYAPSVTNCNTYFVGLKNGNVYRTTVGGGTLGWTNISTGLPTDANQYRGVNNLAVHPTNANIIYAAISGFGGPHLYKTTNALDTTPVWNASDTGIPDIPINAVEIDPTDTNYVYIGTDIGIYRSSDAGTSWQVFNNGHPRIAVYDIVANGATNTIMSFTHGRSAFKLVTVATGDPGEVPMKDGGGTPLTVSKLGPDLVLTWGAPGGTCQPTDYGIYRGTVGNYYSHDQFLCTDYGADLTETIIAGIDSYYYLIVARTDTEEGSYGKDTNGTQRPVGITKCVPTQNLTACN